MNVEQFTLNPDVVNICDDLETFFKEKPLLISDIVDQEENQYVDLVQEGGGILGISLLGFTYVLEQMKIRFLNIGGTSAGAINSLLLAAIDKPEKEKTTQILELLANKNLSDFVDGDDDARDFVNSLVAPKVKMLSVIINGIQILDNLKEDMGINPGENFHNWLKDVLKDYGIHNTSDLEERMTAPKDAKPRKSRIDIKNNNNFSVSGRLAIIAAEVNTETKIEFPAMRELFYENIDEAHPADFVRASMSIPLFFKPFEITNLPADKESIVKWKRIAQHRGGVPKRALFVDGGVMSNFPIDVFHRIGIPSRPTIGVKLGLERKTNKDIRKITELLFGCFDAARNLRDFEFIHKNPDYKNLVSFIDTSDYDWIDFDIKDETQVALFVEGAEAAKEFLQNFDWEKYKRTRQILTTSVYSQDEMDALVSGIIKAAKYKKIDFSETDINSLKMRVATLNKRVSARLLWIDDKPDRIQSETRFLEAFGIHTKTISSTEEAKKVLITGAEFDYVISDISRFDDGNAGVQFIEWLASTHPYFKQKIIYYINDLDLSLGVPPYAFGITDHPAELLHLIFDLSYRRK